MEVKIGITQTSIFFDQLDGGWQEGKRGADMMAKMSIWVLASDAPHGGYLFRGNPNSGVPGVPPYHLGGIENLLFGEVLVWEHTRSVLEKYIDILWWNERFPKLRVKPKSIMVEMRPYYKRAKKEGATDGK